MTAQRLYDIRPFSLLSGTDLHSLFEEILGNPSPSGKTDETLQDRRPVGRPRSSNRRARLNLYLPPEVIANMKAIALKEGFTIKVGKLKGEPNISAWLSFEYGDRITNLN